ncbi:MAG: type VI secretion system baseplate subunit TssF [Alphaproteobacteria bacterium]|nr:type VI secretion system baseplate subunit TssF [Alphaproteobacteria bacterium]
MKDKERHLFYYQRELSFLREMGAVFAEQHPKIAKRLGLSKGQASDPHVERLIESFAFLTSYIQKDLDGQFPRLSSSLLDTIMPILTRPIPSMGIAEFALDTAQKMTSGQILPAKTPVYTESADVTQNLRFHTTEPIHFNPIQITSVSITSLRKYSEFSRYKSGQGLLVTLKSLAGSFAQLAIPSVRFFLNMQRNQSLALYSYIMRAKEPIAVLQEKIPHIYPGFIPQPVGMKQESLMLPSDTAQIGYALLQEYFCLPEKFLFVDIPLPKALDSDEITVMIPLATAESLTEYHFSANSLLLHCTPIVNLFEKITEPLSFDHKKVEYRLIPDRKRQKSTEIYSIHNLYTARSMGEKEKVISPYFSYNHEHLTAQNTMFWNARRVAAGRGYRGTNMYISFVDKDASPLSHIQETVYARTLCTNRGLAADIQPGTQFYSDVATPAATIMPVMEMTEPLYPSLDGINQWKLISMLATSYTEFSTAEEGVDRLKNLLTMLSEKTLAENQSEIQSVLRLQVDPCIRRFQRHKEWAGFYNGNHVKLHVDEHTISAEQLYLLLSILSEFFATQTHMHAFSMLSVSSNVREGVWHTWQPRAGEAQTL